MCVCVCVCCVRGVQKDRWRVVGNRQVQEATAAIHMRERERERERERASA